MSVRGGLAALSLASIAACGSSSSPPNVAPTDAAVDAPPSQADAEAGLASVIFSCEPADVSQFTAPAYRPAKSKPSACSPTQIDAFYAACLASGATNDSCNAFAGAAANAACVDCLVSSEADPSWGPVVDNGRFVSMNVDGCMELVDPGAGKSCAAADQAASACEDQACKANCGIDPSDPPAQRQAELAAYDACTLQADHGGCGAFASAASCVDRERDGGAASPCFAGATFQALYEAIAPIFCGGALADAGADGG